MPSALDLLSAAALLEEETNSSNVPSTAGVDVAEIARQALGFPPSSQPPQLEYTPYRYPPRPPAPPPPPPTTTTQPNLPPLPTLPQPQFFTTASGSAKLALPVLPPLPFPPPPVSVPIASTSTLPAPLAPTLLPPTTRPRSPPSWTLPADLGLIRCVCPYTFDDGFTIQCDLCNAWQHAGCVGILSESEVPDEYQCERCDPLDAQRRGVSREAAERGMRERVREMARVQQAGGLRVGPPSGPSTMMDLGKAVPQVLRREKAMEEQQAYSSDGGGGGGRRRSLDANASSTGNGMARSTRGSKPRRSGGGGNAQDDSNYVPSSSHTVTTTTSLPLPPPPPVHKSPESSTSALPQLSPKIESSNSVLPSTAPTTEEPSAMDAPAESTPPVPSTSSNGGTRTTAVGRKRRVAKQPRRSNAAQASATESNNDVDMEDDQPSPRGGSPEISTQDEESKKEPILTAPTPSVLAPPPRLSALGSTRTQVASQHHQRSAHHEDLTSSESSEDDDFTRGGGTSTPMREKYEPWQYEFTSISSNLFPDPSVVNRIEDIFSRPPISPLDEIDPVPAPKLTALRKRQLALRSKSSASKTPILSHFVDTPSYTSLPSLPPSLPLLIKPLPSSSYHLKPPISSTYLPTSYSSSLHASSAAAQSLCPYPRPTTHAVYSTNPIPSGTFIDTYQGEIKSLSSYRSDPVNQYDLLGSLKAGVRGLGEPWSLVVDSRKWGKETRFIRSGCHPNCVLKVIKLPEPDQEKGEGRSRSSTPHHWSTKNSQFVLGIYSIADISKREELILPWDWDDSHLLHLLPSLLSLPSSPSLPPQILSNEGGILELIMRKMAISLDSILGSAVPGGCACEKKRDCALWWGCRGAVTTVKSLTARSQGGRETRGDRDRERNNEMNWDKEDREKDREPFRAMLFNALNPGVVTANGSGGGEMKGRKKGGGQGRKWPELGALIGFERGWIVEEELKSTMRRDEVDSEEEMNVDGVRRVEQPQNGDIEFDSPLSELAELEQEAIEQTEKPRKLELEGLRVADASHLGISPSSALTSLPSEGSLIDPFSPAKTVRPPLHLPPPNPDRSIARRSSRDSLGAESDDSDLTEPLSNLSDEEDMIAPRQSSTKPVLKKKKKPIKRASTSSPPPPTTQPLKKKKKVIAIESESSDLSEQEDEVEKSGSEQEQVKEPVQSPKKRKADKKSLASADPDDVPPVSKKQKVPKDRNKGKEREKENDQDLAKIFDDVIPAATTSQPERVKVTVVKKTVQVEQKERKKIVIVDRKKVINSQSDKKGSSSSALKKLKIHKHKNSGDKDKIREKKSGSSKKPKIRDSSSPSPPPSPDRRRDSSATENLAASRESSMPASVPSRRSSQNETSNVESMQEIQAELPREPTPPPPEPPKPVAPPVRLSFAAYRQRQAQAPPLPPPPPPYNPPAISASPAITTNSLAEVSTTSQTLIPPSPALHPIPGSTGYAPSPMLSALPMPSETPPLPVRAMSLATPSETPPLKPIRPLPPPPPPPPPPAPPVSRTIESTTTSIDEPEAGTPPLPPSRQLAAVPAAPASVSYNSAEDILKSIGDYFGGGSKFVAPSPSLSTNSQITSAPPATPAPAPAREPQPIVQADRQRSTSIASSVTSAPASVGTSKQERPRQFSISITGTSLSGSALGLDTGVPSTSTMTSTIPSPSRPSFRAPSATPVSSSSAFGRSNVFPPSGPAARGGRTPSASPAMYPRAALPNSSNSIAPPLHPSARTNSVSPALTPAQPPPLPIYAGSASRPSPPIRPVELDPSVPTGPKAMGNPAAPPIPAVSTPSGRGTGFHAQATPGGYRGSGRGGSTPGRAGFHGIPAGPRHVGVMGATVPTPRGRGWGWGMRGGRGGTPRGGMSGVGRGGASGAS